MVNNREISGKILLFYQCDVHRPGVFVVDAIGGINGPANAAVKDDITNRRPGDIRLVEIGGFLVARLVADDVDIVFAFLDGDAARCFSDGYNGLPLADQITRRTLRRGIDTDFLGCSLDNRRTASQRDNKCHKCKFFLTLAFYS